MKRRKIFFGSFTFFLRMCLLACWLSGPAVGIYAQTAAYTITDLGTLGGTNSYAYSINNLGQIVGDALVIGNNATHATFFTVSNNIVTRTDLGTLGGINSHARGINNLTQIVGYSELANSSHIHATLFQTNGAAIDMGAYDNSGITNGSFLSAAYSINDSGQVVGASFYDTFDINDVTQSCGIYTINSSSNITYQMMYDQTVLFMINNRGDYAGICLNYDLTSGYSYLDGLADVGGNDSYLTDYSYDDPDSGAAFFGIGEGDQFLGSNEGLPIVVTPDGSSYDINYLNYIGGYIGEAYAINAIGQVVGNLTTQDVTNHPFIYTVTNGTPLDLNNLVGVSPAATNISFNVVNYNLSNNGNYPSPAFMDLTGVGCPLNDWGQIVANGTVGGYTHALLLNPAAPSTTTGTAIQDSKLVGGLNYDLIPAYTNTASGSKRSVVSFLDGVAGNNGLSTYGLNRDVQEHFGNNSSPTSIASDTIQISGTGNDINVIQLTFNPTNAETLFGSVTNARLCVYRGISWLHNAVEVNSGGTPLFVGNRSYNPTTDFHLGTYGIEVARHYVWAVVNSGGTFGVAMDPDTLKKIKAFTHTSANSTLTFDSYTGYTYELQQAVSLTSGFVNVKQVSGSTGITLKFINDDSAYSQSYYRIQLEP